MACSADPELALLVDQDKVDFVNILYEHNAHTADTHGAGHRIPICGSDEHAETSGVSLQPSRSDKVEGITLDQAGESTGEQNLWIQCGNGAVSCYEGGMLDPEGVVGNSQKGQLPAPVVVNRVSISAMTIRAPVSVEGRKNLGRG